MVNRAMPPAPPVRVVKPLYGGDFETASGASVAFALPGELVRADPLRVMEAAADRVEPGCVHFGACGGCQYQHLAYAAQPTMKVEILRGIFARAGLEQVVEIATRQAAPWGYRNRIRLRVEGAEVGYSRRGSNQFLPIRMCPIAAPLLWRAAEAMLRVATRKFLAAVSEVELFCAGDETRLQARFFLREPLTDAAWFEEFCERLRDEVPELTGAGAEPDAELNRRVRRRWAGSGWGAAGLNYEVAGVTYWASRGTFFQVNRFLLGELVELVCGEAGGELAWDLFAGVGLFTRVLAQRFGRVVAVEAGDAAAADLVAASRRGTMFEAVHAPTLDFLRGRELQRERPELIVLDPPRAGIGVEAAGVLARIGAPHLVYVSCDPITLARDLLVMTKAGYRIGTVTLVDLFPQTFHIETVVEIRKAD